ncbi:MAG: undecaprenyl/decaprenyl-phosphate alpha-N-acetylglucosaminyl 1-phosphate transferase, partial [Oscillospiraceae bacterium]|nr:undecaprenyl/decaprenyl-phosphate alpha-N-acetylglucosaminyl 1-phosphate transferase [Oscillospiraceae bacterium]
MITMISKDLLIFVGGAVLCAMIVSYLMCPLVKSFAYKIGAIDVPKDNRRMHKKPTPRLGGLAIFLGFIVSILLFVNIDHQMQGILLGAVTIVVLGVVDDMSPLRAGFKFLVQI